MKKKVYNNIVWGVFITSLLLNISLWVLVLVTFPKDTPAAILHYTVGFGIDVIGEGEQITILPLIGSILLIINAGIAYTVIRASKIAFWIFWMAAPIIQIILLGSYITILKINI